MEPVSITEAASKTMPKASCALLDHFAEAIETGYICARINIGKLNVKQFLKPIMFSIIVPATKISDAIMANVSARSKPLKLSMFSSFFDCNFQEIDTEKVEQVLHTSLAVETFLQKYYDGRTCHLN